MKRFVKLISIVTMMAMLLTTTSIGMAFAEEKLETLSIRIMNPIFSASPLGTPVMDEYMARMEAFANKELGVTLAVEWEEPGFWDYLSTESVYLASGDFPDIFYIYGLSNAQQVGDSGLLVDLNAYMDVMTYYPEFLKNDPSGHDALVSGETGAVYSFTDAAISNTNASFKGNYLRFDALQKNNITPPTSMDEVYNVCKQLKGIYPASYPFCTWDSDILNVAMMWMHTDDSIYWNGESYVFGPLQEQDRVKEAVSWMAKMYAEGLIDPEYSIKTEDQLRAKMLNDSLFMIPDCYLDQITQYINKNENFPEVEWGTTKQPTNLRGEITWQAAATKKGTSLVTDHSTVINAKTKEPEKLARLVDFGKYNEEMLTLVNWGIEGTTYSVDDQGVKSYLPEIQNAAAPALELAKFGLSTSCRSGIILMPQMVDAVSASMGMAPVYKDGAYTTSTIYEFGDAVNGAEALAPYQKLGAPYVTFSEDEQDDISRVKTPIDTYVSESLTKFMVGEWDINTQWDSFVETIGTMGDIMSIVEMYNAKLK